MASKLFLEKAYLAYFGRPVDPTGKVDFAGSSEADVIAAFSASPESKALYGTGTFGATQINAIYNVLFGRDAEAGGLAYWVHQLELGLQTPASAAIGILEAGLKTGDGIALNNKLAASAQFTAALDTPAEINAYTNAAAAAAARAFLKDVYTTPATPAAIDAAVAHVVEVGTAGGTGVVGSTFTLTAGADAIVGTAGNDTINALFIDAVTGADKTTFSAFDSIDGGAGNDTLNIYTKAGFNDSGFPAQVTVKNVETINYFNADGGVAIDASKFVGATKINQTGFAGEVTNLAATTTAGFHGVTARLQDQIKVSAADAATSATIALDGVKGSSYGGHVNAASVNVSGLALNSVKIDGTLAQRTVGDVASTLDLNVTAGTDVQSVAINTTFNTTLTVNNGAGKPVTTVDASASTGGINYTTAASTVAHIRTGNGADEVTLRTALNGTTITDASVSTGAGNDIINVMTTGTGLTAVNAGAGDDVINVTKAAGNELYILGGDGNDTVVLAGVVALAATDVIDGGAGMDTLSISAAAAHTASADVDVKFAASVTGFEKLVLTDAGSQTVDVKALGNYNFVSTAGGTGLTLSNLASGGTLELTGTGTAYTVINTDFADGTADVLKLALKESSGSNVAFGVITAEDVETIAITNTDTQATPSGINSLTLVADSAKTITVAGNAGLILTTTDTSATLVDASGITLGGFGWTAGALANAAVIKGSATGTNTVTFTAATKAVTYTGGTGVDVVTALNGHANVINTGAGDDVIVVGNGANQINAGDGNDHITVGAGLNIVTGGAGADTFKLGALNANGNTYTTITDFTKTVGSVTGDTINLSAMVAHGPTNAVLGAKVTLAGTAAFADFLNAATAGHLAAETNSVTTWFQFNGDTYLVVDNNNEDTFISNATSGDQVVKLTGLIDLACVNLMAAI